MSMEQECKNKDCVRHMPVVHGGSCILTGKNKCQDFLHGKECFTKEDLELLSNVLENYASKLRT